MVHNHYYTLLSLNIVGTTFYNTGETFWQAIKDYFCLYGS